MGTRDERADARESGRHPGLLVMLATAVLFSIVPARPARRPIYGDDFPDPFILVADGRYWAYSTGSAGRNLQVISSPDLRAWSEPRDPLPVLPAWAEPGFTWAPRIATQTDGPTRRYLMYYTVRDRFTGRQAISVASATSPGGPFVDDRTGPLVSQAVHYGSMDPFPFNDGTDRYLLWKSDDNSSGSRTHLWGQRLAPDGLSLVGPVQKLLEQTHAWQMPVMEGPAMVHAGDAYELFYAANDWSRRSAGIGYATCLGPLGPCEDRSTSAPWLGSERGALGPSGPTVFNDLEGNLHLGYHAWVSGPGYEAGGRRELFVAPLRIHDDGRASLG